MYQPTPPNVKHLQFPDAFRPTPVKHLRLLAHELGLAAISAVSGRLVDGSPTGTAVRPVASPRPLATGCPVRPARFAAR